MKKILPKFFLLCALSGLVALIVSSGLLDQLSFEILKAKQNEFISYRVENPFFVASAFLGLYILVAALSLPGALPMTLAGGAIFGLWQGALLVSAGSSIGATLAAASSRYLLRDWIESKYGNQLAPIHAGLERQGSLFLLSIRLVPLFPFFLVNLLMGLTRMPLRNFFFVSILGMAPATILFVNAGTELASLESPTGILSPRILFSLAALGIFPWLAKAFVSLLESRRVYARFQKPKKFDYNMIVIGAGAAGLVSSLIAATLRARVLLIEKHKMGGDCLNTGCVPSKAIIRSAKLVHQAKNSSALGLSPVEIPVDFAKVMDRVTSVVRAIEPHDSVERYTKLGVECLAGNACLIDPWTVEVDGKKLTTRNIILASGAEPALPTFPGLDQVKFFTTDTLWNLRELPKRLLILGGGPIGCELAQAFSRLGARVTQVEANDRILAREDSDVAEVVTERFRSEGIEILARHRALRFEQKGDSGIAVLETNGQEKRVEFDAVLIALGRKARTKGFGLEALGVQLKKSGEIEADSFLRTNFPNIYVCGDATGPYQFTHMAAHQAWFASINALFAPFWKFKVDYRIVPWCTYTDPEVARVGLSESEAKSKGIQVDVTKYGIDDLDRAIADGETHGFVKVLTQPGSDKILGATIVGAHAGEILIEFVTAMKFGIGLGKILQTIHSYPTFAEANKFAAGVWRKERAPEGLLRILGKIHSARR
jgi:pyruvate/2-oxoglutarate dehydrogenase complex dihydrolipoamide dehydrogenase (E3) component/uncharacterized membrane protein YdjX (TVP38/TMEM64 family)